MKLKERTIKVVELNEDETKLFTTLLNYCYHRATCHQSPITSYQDKINKMRKELKIIK